MWVDLNGAELAVVRELEALPDRAAAIVGATILESRLEARLRKELADFTIKEKLTMHDRMFKSSGPLSAFSAQINLGFMLRLYDESAWRDMDRIRNIRNDFAHVTEIGSFNERSVADRCANFRACDTSFFDTDKESHLTCTVGANADVGLVGKLELFIHGVTEKLSNPRHRYLLCVMYYTAFLGLPAFLLSARPAMKPVEYP